MTVLDHNFPVHDYCRNVASLGDMNECRNRVERGCEVCAAKIEKHKISFFPNREAAEVVITTHRLCGTQRCHVEDVARLPEIVDRALLQASGSERPTHGLDHITMH